jgi:hypothetical protein
MLKHPWAIVAIMLFVLIGGIGMTGVAIVGMAVVVGGVAVHDATEGIKDL